MSRTETDDRPGSAAHLDSRRAGVEKLAEAGRLDELEGAASGRVGALEVAVGRNALGAARHQRHARRQHDAHIVQNNSRHDLPYLPYDI